MALPEITIHAGRKAKQFVVDRLRKTKIIVIKVYKTGKFGGYIVDVFYLPGSKDPHEVAAKGRFLNQELLDAGLATIWKG